jgi:hypothetical protein
MQGGVKACLKGLSINVSFVKVKISPCLNVGAVVSSRGVGFCGLAPSPLRSGTGRAGRRTIAALIDQDAAPSGDVTIASYSAPGPGNRGVRAGCGPLAGAGRSASAR